MSTLTTGSSIEFQRTAAGGAAAATQTAAIAARLERLPMTSYQRGLFAIIATAWFFDSMDLGALTFVLGPIRQSFGLSASETGLLSSMSFLGMFLGAASAGLLADRFGRTRVFQVSMIFWGASFAACRRRCKPWPPPASCSASAWAWNFRSRNRWSRK
jgi:putative MFS transporter